MSSPTRYLKGSDGNLVLKERSHHVAEGAEPLMVFARLLLSFCETGIVRMSRNGHLAGFTNGDSANISRVNVDLKVSEQCPLFLGPSAYRGHVDDIAASAEHN